MAEIVFYEKPGCATNRRQRLMLESAGHTVTVRDLLAEPWSGDRLRRFFGTMPVEAWFNPAAPRVKSGEIDPAGLEAKAALALMLEDPLLIRRPLIESGDLFGAGFDGAAAAALLGPADGERPEGCAHPPHAAAPCPDHTKESAGPSPPAEPPGGQS